MTTKTLGSMMAAASLFAVTACGSVLAPPTGGDDTGSGSGSEEVPTACASASDCTDGTACDLEAKECVSDTLTIDNTDLVSDGLRYWTATSGPKLVGSYQGSADAVVQVKVGSGAPIAAMTDGARWSVQLAAGTILETDTLVSVTLTDPGQGVVELEGVFAMDGAAPTIALGASKVRDERGDVITFDDTGPKHEHVGAEIDLAAGGCPVVYKYSYLMDTAAPLYGSETAANPLAWAVSVQDTKVASVEFRVVDAAQSVVRDWTPSPGNGAAYPIVLFRDGMAGIGAAATRPGKYTIEVRAKDWGDRMATSSYCFELAPLAAPLKIAQPVAPTDADGIAAWSLVANSPISRLTTSAGVAVMEQALTQYSSEPVHLMLGSSVPVGTRSTGTRAGWFAVSTTADGTACIASEYACTVPASPTASSNSGALSNFSHSIHLVDANGVAVPPSGLSMWTIPGRAAGAPPTTYRVRVRMGNIALIGFSISEYASGLINYTGTAATQTTVMCSKVAFGKCQYRSTFHMLTAINTVGLTLQPFALHVQVGASPAATFAPPAHVPGATFTTPALDWTGGDENTL